jgi:hypothetical protein
MEYRTPRTHRVNARLKPNEHAHFAAVCRRHGITVSEGLRRLARAAGGLGPTFDGEAAEAVHGLSLQVRAIGVNLNQIARAMNHGLVPEDATLRQVLEQIAETIDGYDSLFMSMVARSRKLAEEGLREEAEAAVPA